jgi:hypothetical protein
MPVVGQTRAMSLEVHVVPGESAASGLKEALGEADDHLVVGLRDSLSCGPLPNTASLEEWTSVRRQFWAEVIGEDPFEPGEILPNPELLRSAQQITIWLGNGLGDQLALPWLCWFLELLSISSERVRVVRFPLDFAARHRTPSLGMLSPELIRQHRSPRHLDADEANELRIAWSAITGPDPTALGAVVDRGRSHLHQCLSRLAWRYPHSSTGLNFWERALLENVQQHGPKAAYAVGHTLAGLGWDADPVGDGWLLWRLRRLSILPVPLVRLLGDSDTLRGTRVELLRAGGQVLEGAINLLDINPIDDWVAGVHLDSRTGGTWVTSAGPELDAMPLPNSGLQLTWRSLALAPRS